jgi:hypothetical protein
MVMDGMQTAGLGMPNFLLAIQMEQERWAKPWTLTDQSPSVIPGTFVEPYKKLTLVFYSRWNLTLCDVGTEYVDSVIDCSKPIWSGDNLCSVRKMRRSPGFKGKGNLTALDIGRTESILKHIPYTMASFHPNEPSILEKWLKDPTTAFQKQYGMDYTWYEDLPLGLFSNRLAVVLNTYLRAMFDLTVTVGSEDNDTSVNKFGGLPWTNTTGTWNEFTDPVYYISMPWFIIYVISALVLTVCGFTNIVLRSLTQSPDIIGSIAALTRDSQFFDTPAPASGMDGSERSRLLQNKWVMIQDVRSEETIGRIAFSDDVSLVPLSKDRMYV